MKPFENKPIIYVMGVSGSGKSTIGEKLAHVLGLPYFDADAYHPPNNIKKMKAGIPLNDEDRKGWLKALNEIALQHKSKGCVITCSALKKSYRQMLGEGLEKQEQWIYLKGGFQQIQERLRLRKNHYMPPELLQSQFDILEPPENAIVVDVSGTPHKIVSKIVAFMKPKTK